MNVPKIASMLLLHWWWVSQTYFFFWIICMIKKTSIHLTAEWSSIWYDKILAIIWYYITYNPQLLQKIVKIKLFIILICKTYINEVVGGINDKKNVLVIMCLPMQRRWCLVSIINHCRSRYYTPVYTLQVDSKRMFPIKLKITSRASKHLTLMNRFLMYC